MKMFFHKAVTVLMILVLSLSVMSGCGSIKTAALTIIHMNDTHGRTHAEPYVSQMASELKAEGKNVLILDAGDRLHGQIATNLTEGETMVEIMNAVGYDAMVTGNHEYTFGVERLTELSGMMNFPLLAANVRDTSGTYLFEKYRVFKMDGLTVGVFGLVTPETVAASDPNVIAGLVFENPVESAAAMVTILEAEKCDVIVALAHLGESSLTAEDEKSDAVASLPGVDVVIDGHSHTQLNNGRMAGNVLIAQTGEYGQNIGIVEIKIEKGEIIEKTARLEAVPAEESESLLSSDEAIVAKIAEGERKVEAVTSIVVGHTPVRLEGEREAVRTGDTNLANLITDSMLFATGAEISFLSGGSIRASIEAGDITMGDVLTVLPYSNLIVTVEMKGADIWDALEHGVSLYPEQEGQFMQVGGLTFSFEPEAESMGRVREVYLANGDILQLDKTYTVATIEYLAAGGDGYTMIEKGVNLVYYQGDAEAFVEYLKTSPPIHAESAGRIVVSQ